MARGISAIRATTMNICKTSGKIMVLSGGVLGFFAILCHFDLINQVPPFVNLVLLIIAVAGILLGVGFMLAGKGGKKSIGNDVAGAAELTLTSISTRERNSLILGVLAFIVGPVVGVFAIFYILRRLRDPNCTKTWPHRLALCLAVIGILVFCVTTLLLVSTIIQQGQRQ